MGSKELSNLKVESILEQFQIDGQAAEIHPYGSGLINDTFFVKNKSVGYDDYLLQRINHHVFKDVSGLMKNVDLIIAHLKKKTASDRKVLTLVPTKSDELFHMEADGSFWRLYVFIPGTKSYDLVTTEKQAYEGGRAFGNFQLLLSDMDVALLKETIIDFHNIKKRLRDYYTALKEDVAGRAGSITQEALFIKDREDAMSIIFNWGEYGLIPQRVTHNDTKFNNVLFDENNKVQCVIDFDTVMPGLVAYDFGDAIRTIINTANEDEADLDKIQINIPLFAAYAEGYLEEAGEFLSPKEVESLSLGVLLLPYMQGVRFLTDYLDGDKYFKTTYPEHNLIRARTQFQLLRKLEEQQATLEQILTTAAANNVGKKNIGTVSVGTN
ncbi:phosphotransferase enzyme family protein [Desertivirga arenae]|uniref:phosphotransferase enzyme family protein n=1 Tax=Desertivirga arenae TaxID=2810309 RepID=UPI001A96F9F7|nr:aminoglycoside phosphotransferase family protein [Pedobacter sp. SYSU D00823]